MYTVFDEKYYQTKTVLREVRSPFYDIVKQKKNKKPSRLNNILGRLNEVVRRLNEVVRRLNEIVRRLNEIVSRLNEVVSRLNAILCCLNEIVTRLNDIVSRLNEKRYFLSLAFLCLANLTALLLQLKWRKMAIFNLKFHSRWLIIWVKHVLVHVSKLRHRTPNS